MTATKVALAAAAARYSGAATLLRLRPTWTGVLVLNYHRIGDPRTSLLHRDLFSATADGFDRQLRFLKRHADVISGDDLPEVLARASGRHVMLTFDDGYRDNYDLALPILRAHGLPATFFLCTGFLDGRGIAWWDELAWMIRHATATVVPSCRWLATPIVIDATDPEPAVLAAIAAYRALPATSTAACLSYFAEATGAGRYPCAETDDLWMTWDMARMLRAAGMTIGAHTVSHQLMARLAPDRQRAEIASGRDRITAELGTAPTLFAYPVGKSDTYEHQTKTILAEEGFNHAFAFAGGHQPFAQLDRYAIRRAHVGWRTTPTLFEAAVSWPSVFARW